jgi:hypothetical protein
LLALVILTDLAEGHGRPSGKFLDVKWEDGRMEYHIFNQFTLEQALRKGYFYLFSRFQKDPLVERLLNSLNEEAPTKFLENLAKFRKFFLQIAYLSQLGDGN